MKLISTYNMENKNKTITSEMKELLSDPKNSIKLDDFVTANIKKFIEKTSLEYFPIQEANAQKENIIKRIERYENATKDLEEIVILLARWGDCEKQLLLEKIFDRLIEIDTGTSGLIIWIHMCWYPILLLFYSVGISALSAKKYELFSLLLKHQVSGDLTGHKKLSLVVAAFVFSKDISEHFKLLPGLDRRYAARSERIFSVIRPTIDNLLFLGKSYEKLFDQFEVYASLMCTNLTAHSWGPIGIFGWKYDRSDESPFHQIVKYAEESGKEFELLKSGCFSGSLDKLLKASETLKGRLDKLGWW